MKTILLLHLLPFLHSAPEPDTHLHVYLPPESEQGNSFLVASFSSVSSKGENPTQVEGLLNCMHSMYEKAHRLLQDALSDAHETAPAESELSEVRCASSSR